MTRNQPKIVPFQTQELLSIFYIFENTLEVARQGKIVDLDSINLIQHDHQWKLDFQNAIDTYNKFKNVRNQSSSPYIGTFFDNSGSPDGIAVDRAKRHIVNCIHEYQKKYNVSGLTKKNSYCGLSFISVDVLGILTKSPNDKKKVKELDEKQVKDFKKFAITHDLNVYYCCTKSISLAEIGKFSKPTKIGIEDITISQDSNYDKDYRQIELTVLSIDGNEIKPNHGNVKESLDTVLSLVVELGDKLYFLANDNSIFCREYRKFYTYFLNIYFSI